MISNYFSKNDYRRLCVGNIVFVPAADIRLADLSVSVALDTTLGSVWAIPGQVRAGYRTLANGNVVAKYEQRLCSTEWVYSYARSRGKIVREEA